MKRSKSIQLVLMTTISSSLLACEPNQENQQCVDKDGIVVDESQCDKASPHYNPMHHWYYGGGLFTRGTRASGGSFYPSSNHSYSTPSSRSGGESFHFSSGSSVSRGGFGSTGHGTGGS